MLKRFSLPLLVCMSGFAAPALADDFQQWVQVSAKVDVSDRVVLQNELVARFSGNGDGLYEIENAIMAGYELPGKVTVSAGYVHDPQYVAGEFTVMERRIREQIAIDDFATVGSARLSGRLRMEQRWRDGVAGTGWRARPYLKLSVPLGGKADPTLNVSEEAFINLNNTSFQSKNGLDRLRTAVSLSLPLTSALKLEAGYLNQHRFVSGGPDTDDHALTVSAGFSF